MIQSIEITKEFPASRERVVLLELLEIVRLLKAEEIDSVICGGWVETTSRTLHGHPKISWQCRLQPMSTEETVSRHCHEKWRADPLRSANRY
jgi:hypothetical protein